MVTTPTILPPASREAGFTLVEILVVLAILSMVALLAVPAMRGQGVGISAQRDLAGLKSELRQAHSQALASGASADVRVPDGLSYAPLLKIDEPDPSIIRFYADGSSSGGEILSGEHAIVRIDWLTGEVRSAQA